MNIGWASGELITREDGSIIGGGCFHYRQRVPADYIAHVTRVRPPVGQLVGNKQTGELGVRDIATMEIHWGLDVVVVQRFYNPGLATDIRRARSIGQIVLNDVDDWFEGMDQGNRAWWTTHPNPEIRDAANGGRKAGNRSDYINSVKASSGVICSTPFLADRYADFNPVVAPNLIDIVRWPLTPEPESDAPVVGWMGSVEYRSGGDLTLLNGILGPWLEKTGGSFVHIGSYGESPKAIIEGLGLQRVADRVTHVPGCTINELPKHMAAHRPQIGITPLEDRPFNHAKSHLKGMEYGALGIPSIATATPAYVDYDGTLLAKRPKDWIRHLDRLADPVERASESRRARAKAEEWSIQSKGQLWIDALEQVTGRRLAHTS